ELIAATVAAGVDDMIRTCCPGRLAPHADRVDTDDRIGAGGNQAAQAELSNDTQSEHGGGAAEGQPGPNRGTKPIPGDACQRCSFEIQIIWYFPPSAALVSQGQQFR